ncbi:MAG: queuosine precursor transporter [Deferribacteres bacterium]|nr:queuosine precursor transporter [candidate division KSB1 bacterium]MCB9500841.1 queuosine precursor transporter [Deferribacteres bacterium]
MQKMVTEPHNLKTHARYESIFAILIALFVTFVVLTNTVGVKLFTLYGYTFGVSIFWYPLTFLITDITSEIYGAKRASFMVVVGFSMSVLLLFFSLLGISLPSAEFYAGDEAYVTIFGPVWRLLFASMAAYLLAQLIDVRLFHFWKKLTKGKHLWLRNNGSTIISQLIDSLTVNIIFLYKNPVVFTGDFADVLAVAMNVYVFKVLIALLDTPLCYAGVRLFEKLTGVKGDEVM